MAHGLTHRLCKAARALAGWNQADLAKRANVSKQTITDFERGVRTPFPNNLRAIESALAAAGVEFIAEGEGGAGVRLAAPATDPAGIGGAEAREPGLSRSLRDLERLSKAYGLDDQAYRDLQALLASAAQDRGGASLDKRSGRGRGKR